MKYLSRNTRWVIANGLVLLLLMSLFRIIFYLVFKNPNHENVLDAFVMGLRFDIRIAAIPTLVIWILSFIPFLNPFRSKAAGKVWNIMYILLALIILVFYIADFGHYAYLHQRLNASVLSYTKDAGISTTMIWQSYPVIRWLLGSLFLIWFLSRLIRPQPADGTATRSCNCKKNL